MDTFLIRSVFPFEEILLRLYYFVCFIFCNLSVYRTPITAEINCLKILTGYNGR